MITEMSTSTAIDRNRRGRPNAPPTAAPVATLKASEDSPAGPAVWLQPFGSRQSPALPIPDTKRREPRIVSQTSQRSKDEVTKHVVVRSSLPADHGLSVGAGNSCSVAAWYSVGWIAYRARTRQGFVRICVINVSKESP